MHIEHRSPKIGFDNEIEKLGISKINWQEILKRNQISPEKLRFWDWVNVVEKLYPEDPTMPKKKWGRDLYNFVAEKLGLDVESPEGLYFYNTLGSGLDFMGVDCFFAFKNHQTKKVAIFTIDLTTNPHKEKHKADLVIGETPDHRIKPEEYVLKMEEIADAIAEKLKLDTSEAIH